jgi:hypothetical protein
MKSSGLQDATSEVQKFAHWFHQDFSHLFKDAKDGAAAYIAMLDASRRSALRKELVALLQDNPGMDHRGLQRAWNRLGAQWSPRGESLRTIIEESISALR